MSELVELSGHELERAFAAADAHSAKHTGRRDEWVYDGASYASNNRMAAAAEFAAAKAMGCTNEPAFRLNPYDFVAQGWRVDVKARKKPGNHDLFIRKGQLRKLRNSDVLSLLAPVHGNDYHVWTWIGWIWATEFATKAHPYDAKRTEQVLMMHHKDLLKPGHWRWIALCPCHEGTTSNGPPWPGSRGPW